MAFADHYPLDAFLAISHLSWWRSSDVETQTSRGQAEARRNGETYVVPDDLKAAGTAARAADAADKPLWEAGMEVFVAALRAHLDELRAAGRLAPTGGLRGREVWPAEAWNHYVAGRPDDHHTRWLIADLASILTSVFVRMDEGRHARRKETPLGHHQAPSRDQAVAAWERLGTVLDAGDSDEIWRTLSVECQDQKTGDRCELHFRGWAATLMRRNERHRLEPAGDLGPVPLVHAGFDVPTGDLLLTDYLRVEGMKEAIDLGDDEYGRSFDLCSALGRSNRSIEHAARHGFGYHQTTNTSVSAWRNPATGAIAIVDRWFGREEDEVDGASPVAGWEKVGAFSCDMWRVTAIDAETARRLTSAEAVDSYLALRDAPPPARDLPVAEANRLSHDICYARNVVRVPVEPGRWTIHCGDRFAERLPRHRYGLPKGVRPWCVLTPPEWRPEAVRPPSGRTPD